MPSPGVWFETNPKKTIFLLFVIVFLVIELLVRFLIHTRVVDFVPAPTTERPLFWDDISRQFGVWHHSNDSFRHITSCYDVNYHTNSYGARDTERSEHRNGRRVIVLGDSFVEGLGVKQEERLTDLLESWTQIEHLNFGTSGDLGSIQEWLLYRGLASRFDHTDIFIFLLPGNDFLDNNPRYFPPTRYRPYLQKIPQGFDIYYPTSFAERRLQNYSYLRRLVNNVTNNIYLLNVLKQKLVILFGRTRPRHIPPHNDFEPEDEVILLYTYKQIENIGGGKKIYIFIIPTLRDLVAYGRSGYNFKILQLGDRLVDESQGIIVFDLLPVFVSYANKNSIEYGTFFNSCDGHWTALGNRVAAEAVMHYVYDTRIDNKVVGEGVE